MSTYEVDYAVLDENPHFDLLGFNGDAVFVRQKRFGSICKLRGKPTDFMLAQIAPLAWWRSCFPNRTRAMSA